MGICHSGTRRTRRLWWIIAGDRKSTRLNSSHSQISYAVFCLKKKKKHQLAAADPDTKNHALLPRRAVIARTAHRSLVTLVDVGTIAPSSSRAQPLGTAQRLLS